MATFHAARLLGRWANLKVNLSAEQAGPKRDCSDANLDPKRTAALIYSRPNFAHGGVSRCHAISIRPTFVRLYNETFVTKVRPRSPLSSATVQRAIRDEKHFDYPNCWQRQIGPISHKDSFAGWKPWSMPSPFAFEISFEIRRTVASGSSGHRGIPRIYPMSIRTIGRNEC